MIARSDAFPCFVMLLPFAALMGYPIARWMNSIRHWQRYRIFWCSVLFACSISSIAAIYDLSTFPRPGGGPDSGFVGMDIAYVRIPRFFWWFFPALPVLCGTLLSLWLRAKPQAATGHTGCLTIGFGCLIAWCACAGIIRIVLDLVFFQ